MKFIAIILTFMVLLLAFKPGVDLLLADCESEITCCADSCEPFTASSEKNGDADQKGCDGNSCNPFQSCGSSFVLLIDAIELDWHNPEMSTENSFDFRFNLHSQFDPEYWQPPRLV